MIYLDNTTEYSQRISIPRPIVGSGGGNPHYATLQTKDYEIHNNGLTNIRPDSGYDGISAGTISVYVNGDTSTTFEHLTVQENGEYVAGDAMAYSAVTVNVPTGPSIVTTSLTVTENGEYVSEPGEAYTGVTVSVPTGSTINNQTKSVTITENTSTTITFDAGYTGLEQVDLTINVPGSEIHNQDKSVTITQDIGQGTNYISASTVVTADTGYTGLGTVSVGVAIPCLNSINAGTYSENGQYFITGESMGFPGRPFRQVIFNVNVPSTSTTVTAITATENNRRYSPSDYGVNAFSEVTVQVDTTPYYNEGYSDGIAAQKAKLVSATITSNGTFVREDGYNRVVVDYQPEGDVILLKGYGYVPSNEYINAKAILIGGSASTLVDDWGQLSAATSIVYTGNTGYFLTNLVGVGDSDVFPYYSSGNTDGASSLMPMASTFNQQLPYVRSLKNFMRGRSRNTTVFISMANELADMSDAFSSSNVMLSSFDSTYKRLGAEWAGTNFYQTFANTPRMNNPRITAYTTQASYCFSSSAVRSLANCNMFSFSSEEYAELAELDCPTWVYGICNGCSALRAVTEWNWTGVRKLNDALGGAEVAFGGCSALTTIGGFVGLGSSFRAADLGYHTLDLSDLTTTDVNVSTSVYNICSKLGTVPSDVTDAKIIFSQDWAATTDFYAYAALAVNKGWQVLVQ